MKKTAKKQSPAMVIAGVAILFVTVVIILLSVFIPRIRENRIFHERYRILETGEYTHFLLTDPLYKTSGAIVTRGVEVALTAEQVADVRASLTTVRAGGLKNSENVPSDGAWDVRLQIRTETGERAELYLTETELYFYADGTAFTFTAKDKVAYESLYHTLQSILKANA